MKQFFLIILLLLLPIMASADAIESSTIIGVYETDPSSYRMYNGRQTIYGNYDWGGRFKIRITDNLDGTYHVSDLVGGYYDQRVSYGSNYAIGGDISIADDGTVILLGSFVRGWGDSLIGLTGKYDAVTSTFTIEAEYVEGMKFYQTWIKTNTVLIDPIFSSDGFNFRIGENNTVSVISKRVKYSGDIVIPSQVSYNGNTYSVTSIDSYAFSFCSGLTSVVIPNSLTTINYNAFEYCTSLISVTIPNSVTYIGSSAFYGCSSLSSITIPNGVTYIDWGTFENCTGITSITFPNSLTSIYGAFINCTGLKSLTIPSGVTNIDCAFIGCTNLTSVTIPNSVTNMEGAFSECTGLTSVNIPNSVTDMVGAFYKCTSLTSITIPNGVTNINGAFKECTGLTSVNIPNSVKSIGMSSFENCTSLTSITIPNSVTSIGEFAFAGCTSLSSVVIPNNVTTIDEYAFKDCTGLEDVYCFADVVPRTSPNIFDDSNIQNAILHVKASSVDAFKAAEPWKNFWKIIASPKCSKPTIQYHNGKLIYNSETENAICESTITDSDIQSYSGNEVQLCVTYNINVYATKMGYEDSEVATATLCWIDADPLIDDINKSVAKSITKAVVIQNNNNVISISGTTAGMQISVYNASGKMVGSVTSDSDITNIPTSLQPGSIAIIKIGDKSVKVTMK